MPEDFDIPDIPDVDGASEGPDGGGGTGGRSGQRGRRRWPWLVAGLILGVVGTLFLPPLVAPHLPETLRSDRLRIDGEVLRKRADAERLLLTVETDSGAMLATFRRRVPAIDLLVEPGDSITLLMERYRPFVEEPGLQGVRKGSAPARGAEPAPPTSGEADGEPSDTAADDTGADTAAAGESREAGTGDTVRDGRDG